MRVILKVKEKIAEHILQRNLEEIVYGYVDNQIGKIVDQEITFVCDKYYLVDPAFYVKYLEYLSDDDRKEYKPENTLSKLSDKVKSKISGVPSNENKKTNKDDELIKSFFLSTDDKNWENYVVSTKDKNGKIAKKQLEDIISEFQNKNSSIYLKNDYDGSDKNANYELSLFSADTQKFYQTLRPETNVIVVDFRKQRELVEYRISELKTIIKDQQEAVQLEINEKILKNFNDLFGFKPTIDKCFE